MRRIGDLFTSIGFKPEASDSVKTAFLNHLKKAAQPPSIENLDKIPKHQSTDQQLSFDLEVLQAGNQTTKKSA